MTSGLGLHRPPSGTTHVLDVPGTPSPLKPVRVFEAYADTGGKWRWRSKATNGRIAAVSGESFASKKNAVRAARKEASLIPGAILKNED